MLTINLVERLHNMTEQSYGVTFHRTYSGRDGCNCIGLSGSRTEINNVISKTINEMINYLFGESLEALDRGLYDEVHSLRLEVHANIQTLINYKQDNMGLDVIFYWPDIEYLAN